MRDNLLEVAHAGRFDALALGFLGFFLQAEIHGQRFLLGLLLGLDRRFQGRRELDVPQENVLYSQAAFGQLFVNLFEDLFAHHFAFAGVKSVGAVRGCSFADGGAQRRLDHDVLIVGPDLLEDLGGTVGGQVIDERGVETHHQPFARGHAGRFLESLCLDRHLVVGLEWIDQMDAFAQSLVGNSAKQREHAHMSGAYARDRAEQQDHQNEGDNSEADQSQNAAAGAARVDDSGSGWIEDRH